MMPEELNRLNVCRQRRWRQIGPNLCDRTTVVAFGLFLRKPGADHRLFALF